MRAFVTVIDHFCLFWHIHAEDFACLILAASYENDNKSMIISGTILILIMIIVRSTLKGEEGVGCRKRSVEEGDTQTGYL